MKRLFAAIFLSVLSASASLQAAPKQDPIKADAPAEGIKLVTFNDAGNRFSMLRGTQAHYVDKRHIDVTDMTLTLFVGDQANSVDTLLLSPLARATLDEKTLTVHGDTAVRLIKTDDFEVSGEVWTYTQTYKVPDKRIVIDKNVHVIFHGEIQDLLK